MGHHEPADAKLHDGPHGRERRDDPQTPAPLPRGEPERVKVIVVVATATPITARTMPSWTRWCTVMYAQAPPGRAVAVSGDAASAAVKDTVFTSFAVMAPPRTSTGVRQRPAVCVEGAWQGRPGQRPPGASRDTRRRHSLRGCELGDADAEEGPLDRGRQADQGQLRRDPHDQDPTDRGARHRGVPVAAQPEHQSGDLRDPDQAPERESRQHRAVHERQCVVQLVDQRVERPGQEALDPGDRASTVTTWSAIAVTPARGPRPSSRTDATRRCSWRHGGDRRGRTPEPNGPLRGLGPRVVRPDQLIPRAATRSVCSVNHRSSSPM